MSKDGAVIDGLDIAGTVTVTADDVVIRNTRIRNTGHYPVRLLGAANLLIEDSEIDGQGKGDAAVAFNHYTLRRVNIHDVVDGPRIAGDDVTIEDSYVHALVGVNGSHTDALQIVGGRRIVVRGNNLQAYDDQTGQSNAAVMLGEEDSPVRDCLIEDNLLNGGNYTVNAGGGGTRGAQCVFRDNRFGRDARYGARANLGPAIVWDRSNAWLDSGRPIS
ncbi:right-handed parallel beta-helix repeat-containing protein [Cellulomonas sp. WB94]|uniref:right-handed parallel beta-helix repeat-containing protein n=1 Tax=Cellulomonas sp. WB94 TaxID=2173174 RepID=UPI001304D38A|nr:right-handed parallel beta-helix repeat-containing protein [Cellulomonas sp. WB94]